MKKILLVFWVLVFLSSCATKTPFYNVTYFVDYRTFLEKDFFITESDAVHFKYDALGHMETAMHSREKEDEQGKVKTGLLEKKNDRYVKVTLEDAITDFCEQAKLKGADGVLKLKIEPIIENAQVGVLPVYEHRGYRISGMLIKIKN